MFEDSQQEEESLDSMGNTNKVKLGKKLTYEERYVDGEWCDAKKRPRETTVIYYCDQYYSASSPQYDESFKIIDASEPDYCKYQIKVATKFMCTAGAQFPKASAILHTETTPSDIDAAESSMGDTSQIDWSRHLNLDAGEHT